MLGWMSDLNSTLSCLYGLSMLPSMIRKTLAGCPIMAANPLELHSDNISCHWELIYLLALFRYTYGPHTRPVRHAAAHPSLQSHYSSNDSTPHLHLFTKKVTLATWPAIWRRGPNGYPKQAKHNPITLQWDTPHLLNSAWVIFCFSSAACKDSLRCLRSVRKQDRPLTTKGQTSAVLHLRQFHSKHKNKMEGTSHSLN